MVDNALLFSSVAELGRLLRARKVSSVELTELSLAALETQGRELNAVAEVTRELALRQARRADRELREGRVRGPLQGIPYGAKDLLATKGIPTQWGSPVHRGQVLDCDAVVVERLRAAGAVLVGKLAMIELAGGGGYESAGASLHGPCLNPYDRTRWAGGSSSGSGAAVGGGLVPFAIGTETYGSITCPSAFCNISGLRPTYGRVPRTGAMALSWSMDKLGPMARTAEDCGLALAAIAGPDPRDPSAATERFRFSRRAPARPLRLGLLPTEYEKNRAAVAKQRFTAGLKVLRGLGHTTVRVKLPSFPYGLAALTIIDVEAAAAFENLIRGPHLKTLADTRQQVGLLWSLAITGVDYVRALRIRAMAAPVAVRVFEKCDVLVAPTFLHGAPRVSKFSEYDKTSGGNGGAADLLGWPTITVPMGPDAKGMPLGMQFIASPYQEATLLALAMQFQRETAWHRWRPGEPAPAAH